MKLALDRKKIAACRKIAQWRREQAAREMALGKAIDKQQAEIERMERFIERFRADAAYGDKEELRFRIML